MEIVMIAIKERFEKDWRLFDTETNKYVKNTPENRNKAMISAFIENELKKEGKRNAVEQVVYAYYKALETTKKDPVNFKSLNRFLLALDEKLYINSFNESKPFQKLALCVLKDQKDEKTALCFDDLAKYAEEYQHLNKKLLNLDSIAELKLF